MGHKGSWRRPVRVTDEELALNWAMAFGPRESVLREMTKEAQELGFYDVEESKGDDNEIMQ